MPEKSLPVDQMLTMLAEGPRRIAAVTADLKPEHLATPPRRGEWSANEVLAHLRACADVWGGCIETIIAQDRPTIRAINPRTWIDKTDYLDREFRPSLRAFARQRKALLAALESLPPEGWSRAAVVTGAGRPLERSVLFYAQWMATHERPHLKQIERIGNAVRK